MDLTVNIILLIMVLAWFGASFIMKTLEETFMPPSVLPKGTVCPVVENAKIIISHEEGKDKAWHVTLSVKGGFYNVEMQVGSASYGRYYSDRRHAWNDYLKQKEKCIKRTKVGT